MGLATLGFVLLTLAMFRPTVHELVHTTPTAAGDANDALLYEWALDHVSRTLTDTARLFDAGIFYPARRTLAYSDHMIGQAVLGLPVWWATHDPLLEFNLLALGSYVLAAVAMLAYATETIGPPTAAVVAGIAFAFTPFRFACPLWLQLLMTGFMPLALLFWRRFVLHLRWRDWTLWVACWVAHSLMGMYLTLYFAVTMGVLALLALAIAPTRRASRLWAGTLLAPVVTLALLAPTLWPYVVLHATQGLTRPAGLDTGWSFFLPGGGTLTGRLTGLASPARFGPGLVVTALAALGLVAGAAQRDAAARFTRRVHLIGLAATLALVLTPIDLQFRLPFFTMVRNTDRAFLVSLLFVAPLAGAGVAWLTAHAGRAATAVGLALVVLVAADMGTPPHDRRTLPRGDAVPPVYRWLRDLPGAPVIYDGVYQSVSPALQIYYAALPMYYATVHHKRLAVGYSGFMSPGAAYVSLQLARFPDPEALRLMDALDVRLAVWHFGTDAAADRFLAEPLPDGVAVQARFGGDVVFAVSHAPAAPAVAAAVRPLPRAGWQLHASAGRGALDALHDGDRTTVWRVEGRGAAEPPWLVVDLGAPAAVAGVRCVAPDPNAPGIYFSDVELSADGTEWYPTAVRFRPDSFATLMQAPRDVAYWEMRFPTRTARWVRLRNAAIVFPGWPWEIAELDVLADAGAAP